MSPLLPKSKSPTSSDFQRDLFDYLGGYNLAQVEKLKDTLNEYDFSEITERLIISVPGRHREEKAKFGHLSLRQKLRSIEGAKTDTFSIQISSIGSLSQSWIKDFMASFSTTKNHVSDYDKKPDLKEILSIVYPTTEQGQFIRLFKA